MKKNKTTSMMKLILMLTAFCLPMFAMAQDPGGGPDATAPIDGGLSLLIAAGAAYGVKKYRNGKKKGEELEK